jgi:DNA-binding transcriptional LysR family regulator
MRRVLELSSYHAIVVCVASGAGIALVPESVLDVVDSEGVSRHPLPAVFANVITPLIWRAKEAAPAITALQALLIEMTRPVAAEVQLQRVRLGRGGQQENGGGQR